MSTEANGGEPSREELSPGLRALAEYLDGHAAGRPVGYQHGRRRHQNLAELEAKYGGRLPEDLRQLVLIGWNMTLLSTYCFVFHVQPGGPVPLLLATRGRAKGKSSKARTYWLCIGHDMSGNSYWMQLDQTPGKATGEIAYHNWREDEVERLWPSLEAFLLELVPGAWERDRQYEAPDDSAC